MVDQYGQLLRQRLGAAFVDLDAAEVSDPELREVLRAREASYTAEQPSGLYDFEPGPPYRRAAGIRGEDYDLAEMTWQERLVMWRRAHAAWERNPWAKGAIRIIRASTVAQGHTMTYRAASVKTVLEAFRTLPENAIEAYDKQFCEQLLIDGELFVRMTPAPVDRASGAPVSAQVVIDPLPPWWVLEIRSEPQFRRRVRAYWVQLFTGDVPERTYPDDGPQEIPAADVLHVPINLLAYERRGRSELLAVLPWLKLYKDWLEDRARINRYKGNIYFHLSVANATAAQISTLRNQYRVAPPPASILVTSDNQKLETVEPKIGAAEVAEDGRQIKLAAAAGLNLPEYVYAGDAENSNLASTRSQESPANRLFADYQDVMANQVWRPIYRRVVETAIAVGLVEDEEPEIDGEGEPIIDDVTGEPKLIKALEAFDLAYPPPAKEDPKTLTEALVLQLGQELVSRQTAMQDLGRDPQLEIKRIEAEREADTARAAAGFVSNDDDELDLLGQPGAPDMPGTNGTNGTNGRVPAGSTVGGNTTR